MDKWRIVEVTVEGVTKYRVQWLDKASFLGKLIFRSKDEWVFNPSYFCSIEDAEAFLNFSIVRHISPTEKFVQVIKELDDHN